MRNLRLLMTATLSLFVVGAVAFKANTVIGASSSDGFPQPQERRSSNGILFDVLEAKPGSINVGGKSLSGALLYNGLYPARTWRVKPGDRIRVMLDNQTGEDTNLHFHGFHVSPSGISDNVLLDVPNGVKQGYAVNIPEDHPGGLFWYHPHQHGTSNNQVHRGLAGLIVIEGDHDQLPEVKNAKERIMALEYLQLDTNGNIQDNERPPSALQLVNGVQTPTMSAQPNETQFFRVGNTSNDGWFNIAVDGHKMRILAEDGDPYGTFEDVDSFMLAPGKRVEFLVQSSATPGTYSVRNLGHKWGFGTTPAAELAKLEVSGEPVAAQPLPTKGLRDRLEESGLIDAKVDQKRTISFSGDFSGPTPKFLINNQQFDHDRIDIQAKLGTVEEWELVNDSDDEHPFHIHVNDFVVTSINGQPVQQMRLQDVAFIPARGRITIKQRFEDFTGEWVMHCHILAHEDQGMMATVKIVP
jgi:suppressor of ftsI